MDTYVAKVQIGNNANDLSPIGSTMFGVCNSSVTATTKIVTFNKFDKLINGVTIMVKFTNGNSLPGNLKLQVGSTLAYDITGDCICGENEVIAFTFEEIDGTHKYWRANSSGITAAMKEFIINTINTSTDTPDVLIMKGSIGAGGNPGYLPAAGYETGWTYRVVTAGTYVGQKCDVGDLIIAIQDASPSQGSINNAHWIVAQGKIQNVVTNPSPATINHVPIFADGTGKVIGDSGFTLGKSVPADAQFTDTTYTNGTGLELEDTTFSVKFGTTAGTVAEGNDARFAALAPITHTHGNISNDGMLGTGNNLLRTSSGEIVAGPNIGNDTKKYLSNAATWVDIPVTSVNGQTGDVVVDLSSLNIDAMRFIGQATVNITPNSNTNPMIQGYTWPDDSVAGDVILGYTDGREYILDNTFHWILLGQDASTTFDSDSLSADVNRNNNVWVAHIQQASDRTITATMGALDTSGTWTGNAATATAWENACKVYVDLKTASQNIAINGGAAGADAIGIGIDGILGIAHGGTGTDSFTNDQVILSGLVNNVPQLISRAYTDNTQATALSTNNYFITERSVYYSLPLINGLHNYTSNNGIFAPTTSGLQGQILIANNQTNNNIEPIWATAAFITSETSNTASQNAYTTLTLGNNLAVTTTTEHSEGQINLYSSGTASHILKGASTDTNYTHTLQNIDGFILQSEYAGTVGSNYQPVYIDSDGYATALTYTANRLYYSSNTSNFVAGDYYADGSKIAIGLTAWPTSNNAAVPGVLYVYGGTTVDGITTLLENVGIGAGPETGNNAHLLFVNGSSNLDGAVDITGLTYIGNNTVASSSAGALHVNGGILTESNLYVTETSTLLEHTSIGADIDSNDLTDYILSITGSTIIKGTTTAGTLTVDTITQNNSNIERLIFISEQGQIGTVNTRWESGFFSKNLSIEDSSSIDLIVNDGTNDVGIITITDTVPTINLTNGTLAWTISYNTTNSSITDNSVFSITNNAQIPTYLNGSTKGFELAPRLYIGESIPLSNAYTLYSNGDMFINGNIIPGLNNTSPVYNLGSSDNRWNKLYIGTADDYGDEYLPIYWDDGVPTPINGVVQYNEFTFNPPSAGSSTTTSTITLSDDAYNANTCVTQIVVTTDSSYLLAPITWTSGAGTITLTTTVNGTVSGYIITARGYDLT